MLGSVLLHLFESMGHAFPEMGRGYPKHAGDRATAGSGQRNSPPAELPKAETGTSTAMVTSVVRPVST